MDRIHASIVTHNSVRDIGSCLGALRAAGTGIDLRVTVADNASSDDTVARVRESHPEAEVLVLPRNLGFGAAHNHVLARGDDPWMLLLNPDTTLQPQALRLLLTALRRMPEVALVGPRVDDAQGRPQPSFGPFPGPLRDWRQRRLVRQVSGGRPATLRRLERRLRTGFRPDWVSACCWLARRDDLRRVGGFDEGFFLYLEDVDLCRRLRETGRRVALEPAARCVHRGGASLDDDALRQAWFRRSRWHYERKHGSPLTAWAYARWRRLRADDDGGAPRA